MADIIRNNADRAMRAEHAVVLYDGSDGEWPDQAEQVLSDMVGDLRHLADRCGAAWHEILDRSDRHYTEEVAEEATEPVDHRAALRELWEAAGGECEHGYGIAQDCPEDCPYNGVRPALREAYGS